MYSSYDLLFDFEVFQVHDILHALNVIDPKKAPRTDGPDIYLLKAAALSLWNPSHLFTLSIGFNKVPVTLEQAYVTPLFKAGN